MSSISKSFFIMVFLFFMTGINLVADDFFTAIRDGKIKRVKEILADDPARAKQLIDYHSFPIIEAVRKRRINVIEAILDAGANIGTKDPKSGATVMFSAAHYGACYSEKHFQRAIKLFNFLKSKGASPRRTNKRGLTPTYIVATKRCSDKYLDRQIKYLKFFLENGGSLRVRGKLEKSILNKALENYGRKSNSLAMIEFLINNGADVNAPNKKTGDTPLISVIKHRYLKGEAKKEVIRMLIKKGASKTKRNKKKKSPKTMIPKGHALYDAFKKKRGM